MHLPIAAALFPVSALATLAYNFPPFDQVRGLLVPRQLNNQTLPPWSQRNLDTIQKIYDLTVYPHNAPIASHGASAVPAGLFNQDAAGRVSPVGNFTGFADSIEYFFALAPVPTGKSGTAIYKADVVAFTSGCPEVASSLVYLHTGTVDSATGAVDMTQPTTILSQVAFWRFDAQGLVLRYQAWIPNLQAWTQAATGLNLQGVKGYVTGKVDTAAICPEIQKRCTGSNQQYSSTASCVAHLEQKPFGDFDEVWGDNIVCRIIHLILTKVRPVVHCPHVGPVGGSPPDNYKCVDVDYSDVYFDDKELLGSYEEFACG